MRISTIKCHSLYLPVIALLLSTALGGCSRAPERTYRVEGVVTIDGVPLERGTVLFETVEPTADGRSYTARGAVDAQGRYTLGTFTERDGAVAGRHRAAVVPSNVGLGDDADHTAALVVPHEYTSLSTSPLEFEVQRSSNQIDIELHSSPQ